MRFLEKIFCRLFILPKLRYTQNTTTERMLDHWVSSTLTLVVKKIESCVKLPKVFSW